MGCPKCGGATGIVFSVRMNGWAACVSDWSGDMSSEMDGVRRTYPKTGICEDCGKRVPLPNTGDLEHIAALRGEGED